VPLRLRRLRPGAGPLEPDIELIFIAGQSGPLDIGPIDDVTPDLAATSHIAKKGRSRLGLVGRDELSDGLAAFGDHDGAAGARHLLHELETLGLEFAGMVI
jgi:hypothetical protein